MRVFVNGKPGDVPVGATALDAVRVVDAAEAGEIAAGRRMIVDSRGLPADPNQAAFAGAIYRTVRANSASSTA